MLKAAPSLSGKRVLVVGTQPFTNDYICAVIRSAGGIVIGPCGDVEDALRLFGEEGSRPNAMVLDTAPHDAALQRLSNEAALHAIPSILTSSVAKPEESLDRTLFKPFGGFQVVEALRTAMFPREALSDQSKSVDDGDDAPSIPSHVHLASLPCIPDRPGTYQEQSSMIELTAQDGQQVAVNPAAVWHVRQAGSAQTAIYAVSGAAIFVLEPYADVVARLQQHSATNRGASD